MIVYVSIGSDGISLTRTLDGDTGADLERQLVEAFRAWLRRANAVREAEAEVPV